MVRIIKLNSDEVNKIIYKYLKLNKSLSNISKEHSVCRSTITRILRENSVKIKDTRIKKCQRLSANTEFKKGHKIRLGIKHTKKSIEKMSEKLKENYKTGIMKSWNKGKKYSKELYELIFSEKAQEKRSKSLKGMFAGEKSHFWKGGVSKLAFRIRSSIEYKNWRLKVFERDNYTCQGCGKFAGYLEVHHKKGLAKILSEFKIKSMKSALKCKLLWAVSNGITYCKKCHKKVDKFRARFRGDTNV